MAGNTRNFQRDTQVEFGTLLFGEEAVFNIQNVTLPGISTTNPEVHKRGVKGFLQGDSMEFEEITLTFLADEEMTVWKQVMGHMFDHIEIPSGNMTMNSADSWITINGSDGGKVLKLYLHNCSINNIGSLQYDTTSEDEVLTFDVSLNYDYFEIV